MILTRFDLLNKKCKGLPRSEFTIITGLEGVGKTTLLYQFIGDFLLENERNQVYLYNTERSVDLQRVKELTPQLTDWKQLNIIEDLYTYEDIWSHIEEVITKNETQKHPFPLLLAWDSIASTSFKAEQKSFIGDAEMAMRARLLSAIFRKYGGIFKKLGITFLATNQLRFKIGAAPFEEPYVMPGGKAPYYAASLYLYLKKRSLGKNNASIVVDIQVKKNSHAFAPTSFYLVLTSEAGFDNVASIWHSLTENKVLVHSGGASYKLKLNSKEEIKLTKESFPEVLEKHKTQLYELL